MTLLQAIWDVCSGCIYAVVGDYQGQPISGIPDVFFFSICTVFGQKDIGTHHTDHVTN